MTSRLEQRVAKAAKGSIRDVFGRPARLRVPKDFGSLTGRFHSVSALVDFDGMLEASELRVKCLSHLMRGGLATRAHSTGNSDPVVAD